MTSCHHGHSLYPNNLKEAINVIRTNEEIRIVEIDFIQVGDDFVSSHDYTAEGIANGSPLIDWVRKVVIERDAILWIDLKSHLDFTAFCCGCCDMRFKVDWRLLFTVLARICKILQRKIQDKVWISCQEKDVCNSIIRFNNTRLKAVNRWTVVNDIPFIYSYAVNAVRSILPSTVYNWLQDSVFTQLKEYNFERTRIFSNLPIVVCIDKSFFSCTERIIQFVEDSTIPLGSRIVLYTFERTEPPILIQGYDIVMQYDYLPLQLEQPIRKKRRPLLPQRRTELNKSKPLSIV